MNAKDIVKRIDPEFNRDFKLLTAAAVTPTTSFDVTSHMQFIEETTSGSFPASGTMTYIAPMANAAIQFSRGVIPISNIGTYDIYTQVKGLKGGALVLSDMTPITTSFIKKAINRSGGTSLAQTDAVYMKANVGGTAAANQMNISVNFAKPNVITLTGAPGAPLMMDAVYVGRFPLIGTANPLGSVATAAVPTTSPIIFSDGGDTPVTITDSTGTYTPTVGGISLTVNNNLRTVFGYGPEDHSAIIARQRTVAGRISILHTGITYYTNLSNLTGGTMSWVLKTGTGTLSLPDIAFDNGQVVYTAGGDEVYEVYPFRAKSVTIAP